MAQKTKAQQRIEKGIKAHKVIEDRTDGVLLWLAARPYTAVLMLVVAGAVGALVVWLT